MQYKKQCRPAARRHQAPGALYIFILLQILILYESVLFPGRQRSTITCSLHIEQQLVSCQICNPILIWPPTCSHAHFSIISTVSRVQGNGWKSRQTTVRQMVPGGAWRSLHGLGPPQ
jgi:hypothetical protein